MKKLKILIPILLWLLPIATIWVNITKNSSIFDIIDYIKDIIKFDTITINTNIPYSIIQDAINKYCPQKAIDDANTKITSLTNARSTINTTNQEQVLIDSIPDNPMNKVIVEEMLEIFKEYKKVTNEQ